VPPALLEQLAPGGRMVLPVGSDTSQVLTCFIKQPDGSVKKQYLDPVMFVPLLGKQGTGRMPG
jgi:protein-L-isoaspartate(D-aspartate) O-methyltransferase